MIKEYIHFFGPLYRMQNVLFPTAKHKEESSETIFPFY